LFHFYILITFVFFVLNAISTLISFTGPPNIQQGYVHHGGQTMVQTTFPGSVAPIPAAVQPNETVNPGGTHNVAPANTKAQEVHATPGSGDLPPSYNAAAPY